MKNCNVTREVCTLCTEGFQRHDVHSRTTQNPVDHRVRGPKRRVTLRLTMQVDTSNGVVSARTPSAAETQLTPAMKPNATDTDVEEQPVSTSNTTTGGQYD